MMAYSRIQLALVEAVFRLSAEPLHQRPAAGH